MRTRAIVGTAVCVLLAATGCAAGQDDSDSTIKIGYNSSQTGGIAFSDVAASTGVRMAVDEINAAGGIGGKWKIDLSIQDNRSDPGQSSVVARDLIANGVQLQICTADADPCIAAGQIAQAQGIPTISTAATSPTLPAAVGDSMFMSVFGDNTQATVLADFAVEQGYETAYLLCSPDSSYTSKSCDYFTEVFTKKGGEVVRQGSYTLGAPDFNSEISKLKATTPAPDVIFTPAYPPDAPSFMKQLRAAGIDIPVISMDGADSQTTIDAGGRAVDGMVFTTHGFPEPGTPTADFWQRYTTKFGQAPESVFAATGYDLVKVIEAAVIAADSTDPTKIQDAINNLEGVEGATGSITYKGQGRIPLKSVSLVEIVDGEFHYLGTRVPNATDIPKP